MGSRPTAFLLMACVVFLASVLIVPVMLINFWPQPEALEEAAQLKEARDEGLAITFVGLLLWFLVSGSTVAKSFIGGLFFKTLVTVDVETLGDS